MAIVLEWLKESTTSLIWTGSIILVLIIILFISNIIASRFLKHNKRKRLITITRLIQSIVRYSLLIAAIIAILAAWHVDIMPLLAGAGIIGLIVGLGAQQLIRDLLAGISIVVENYYDVDDVIEIKGFKGKVVEIGLRSTRIVGWRGDLKIFANGDITEVVNFSKNPTIGLVEIKLAYSEDLNRVLSLIDENLYKIRDSFPQIIEGPNIVGLVSLGDNGQTIRITVKTISEQHYEVERAIYKLAKEIFKNNGIEISYQRTVIYDEKHRS
jgi:small conductance mechanosensitive channel